MLEMYWYQRWSVVRENVTVRKLDVQVYLVVIAHRGGICDWLYCGELHLDSDSSLVGLVRNAFVINNNVT